MRPIDADAFVEKCKKIMIEEKDNPANVSWTFAYDNVIDEINEQPTIDAVRVVRCKDCKYAHMTYGGKCKYCDIWSEEGEMYLEGDFYCNCGERKTEDETN